MLLENFFTRETFSFQLRQTFNSGSLHITQQRYSDKPERVLCDVASRITSNCNNLKLLNTTFMAIENDSFNAKL